MAHENLSATPTVQTAAPAANHRHAQPDLHRHAITATTPTAIIPIPEANPCHTSPRSAEFAAPAGPAMAAGVAPARTAAISAVREALLIGALKAREAPVEARVPALVSFT